MRTTTLTIEKVFQVNFLIASVDFAVKQAHTEDIFHNSLYNSFRIILLRMFYKHRYTYTYFGSNK